MGRPQKPESERVKSRTVVLTDRDWRFLTALGGEVGGGASDGIRFLLAREKEQLGRVEVTKDSSGNVVSEVAYFDAGPVTDEDGGVESRLFERLDLRTGQVTRVRRDVYKAPHLHAPIVHTYPTRKPPKSKRKR